MKLWPVSDLHLEQQPRGWDLLPTRTLPAFDVMIVAGDVVPRMARGVSWLRQRVVDRPVLFVPGNHESYGGDIDRDLDKARKAAEGSNVHILQDEKFEFEGLTFVCATLWTDFRLFGDPERAMVLAGESMNDFRKIRVNHYARRLRPRDTLLRHVQSREFIASELRRPGRHVVVSHHAPHPTCVRRGAEDDPLSAAYVSDLSALIEQGAPELWIYGHTHETRDFMVDRTRIVSNAKGSPATLGLPRPDNPDFDPLFVVEV